MPELVHVYIRNVIAGFVLAILFTAALLALDVAHLRHLVLGSSVGWIAALMLVVFNTVVFAGVQFAITIMRMAEDDTPPRGGLRAPGVFRGGLLSPARASAPARGPAKPR